MDFFLLLLFNTRLCFLVGAPTLSILLDIGSISFDIEFANAVYVTDIPLSIITILKIINTQCFIVSN